MTAFTPPGGPPRPTMRRFTGPRPLMRPVTDVVSGDLVVFTHRGLLFAEVVVSVTTEQAPAGMVAVRFAGRRYDMHYPARAELAVSR